MPERKIGDVLNSHPAVQLLADIGRYAEDAGYRAAVAGGFVRDLLLGTQNHDIDIVIEGDAPAFAEELLNKMKGTILKTSLFSTVTVNLDGVKVDLVTARSESYPYPGALPVVTPGSFVDDIKRRDFTINAMLLEITPARWGNLLDIVGGKADLTTKTIRILHEDSFRDDPTRMLRAVRFGQRLNFKMEPDTHRLFCRALSSYLRMVSADRLAKELRLYFDEQDWIMACAAFHETGLLQRLFGIQLTHEKIELLQQVDNGVEYFKCHGLNPDRLAVIALILGVADNSLFRKVIGNLSRLQKTLVFVVNLPAVREFLKRPETTPHEIYATLVEIPPTTLAYLWIICQNGKEQAKIRRFVERMRYIHPLLKGCDIAKMVGQGPQVKQLLTRLLFAKLDGQLSSRQEEIDYINNLITNRASD